MGWQLNRAKSRQFAGRLALRRWLAEQTPGIQARPDINVLLAAFI